jgi:hypothetical protein
MRQHVRGDEALSFLVRFFDPAVRQTEIGPPRMVPIDELEAMITLAELDRTGHAIAATRAVVVDQRVHVMRPVVHRLEPDLHDVDERKLEELGRLRGGLGGGRARLIARFSQDRAKKLVFNNGRRIRRRNVERHLSVGDIADGATNGFPRYHLDGVGSHPLAVRDQDHTQKSAHGRERARTSRKARALDLGRTRPTHRTFSHRIRRPGYGAFSAAGFAADGAMARTESSVDNRR